VCIAYSSVQLDKSRVEKEFTVQRCSLVVAMAFTPAAAAAACRVISLAAAVAPLHTIHSQLSAVSWFTNGFGRTRITLLNVCVAVDCDAKIFSAEWSCRDSQPKIWLTHFLHGFCLVEQMSSGVARICCEEGQSGK